jgi:hypothetical protein
MDQVTQLVQRATRLEAQADAMRLEIAQLRLDLEKLGPRPNGPELPAVNGGASCLAVAVALAQDLGPGVSSEEPHNLNERGEGWFAPS